MSEKMKTKLKSNHYKNIGSGILCIWVWHELNLTELPMNWIEIEFTFYDMDTDGFVQGIILNFPPKLFL